MKAGTTICGVGLLLMSLTGASCKDTEELRKQFAEANKKTNENFTAMGKEVKTLKKDQQGINKKVAGIRRELDTAKNDLATLRDEAKQVWVVRDGKPHLLISAPAPPAPPETPKPKEVVAVPEKKPDAPPAGERPDPSRIPPELAKALGISDSPWKAPTGFDVLSSPRALVDGKIFWARNYQELLQLKGIINAFRLETIKEERNKGNDAFDLVWTEPLVVNRHGTPPDFWAFIQYINARGQLTVEYVVSRPGPGDMPKAEEAGLPFYGGTGHAPTRVTHREEIKVTPTATTSDREPGLAWHQKPPPIDPKTGGYIVPIEGARKRRDGKPEWWYALPAPSS